MNLKEYQEFVLEIASETSKDNGALLYYVESITEKDVPVSLLLTAGLGLAGESGEVADIVKKIVVQSKPYTEELRSKLVDEAGDVMWYVAILAEALGTNIEAICARNQEKLLARYPGGKFSVQASENRKA